VIDIIEAVIVPISIAVIGGPLMWLLTRFEKNNSKQHGQNMHVLKRIEDKVTTIETKVSKVDDRLNSHIDKHHSRPWLHFGGKNDRNNRRTD
jgi:hypothetical protein